MGRIKILLFALILVDSFIAYMLYLRYTMWGEYVN